MLSPWIYSLHPDNRMMGPAYIPSLQVMKWRHKEMKFNSQEEAELAFSSRYLQAPNALQPLWSPCPEAWGFIFLPKRWIRKQVPKAPPACRACWSWQRHHPPQAWAQIAWKGLVERFGKGVWGIWWYPVSWIVLCIYQMLTMRPTVKWLVKLQAFSHLSS